MIDVGWVVIGEVDEIGVFEVVDFEDFGEDEDEDSFGIDLDEDFLDCYDYMFMFCVGYELIMIFFLKDLIV